MAGNDHDAEPTQKTPQGHEIPVRKRDTFYANLKKVAPRVEPPAKADAADDKNY